MRRNLPPLPAAVAAALLAALLIICTWEPADALQQLKVVAPSFALSEQVRAVVREASPALTRLTGADTGPITVEVVRGRSEFDRRARALGGPAWAAGLAVPSRRLIVVRSPGQLTDPMDFRFLLIHELTHLHLAAALGRVRHPLWLEEGLAMYAAGEGGWRLAGVMSRGVLMGGLIPLDELERHFPAGRSRAGLAYAQSYYLVSFLLNRYGPQTLPRLLAELRKGFELTRALKSVTGKSLVQVESDFSEEMQSRFSWLALLTAAGAIWALIALGAGVGLVLRRRAHLKALRGMEPEPTDEHEPEAGPGGRRWPPPAQPGSPLGRAGLGDGPLGPHGPGGSGSPEA